MSAQYSLAEIVDMDATKQLLGDAVMMDEMLEMLCISLKESKLLLKQLQHTNNNAETRKILHKLDGTFRYCIAPELQRTRTSLHEAVKLSSKLTDIQDLYDKFYREIDNYLNAYAIEKGKTHER